MTVIVLVNWPAAPLTNRLVLDALKSLNEDIEVITALEDGIQNNRLIQWSAYDSIDHELTHARRDNVLASSYTFRKALIRKHYLAHSVRSYLSKHSSSVLQVACPRTYAFDLAFADELDETWADDLYELGESLDNDSGNWWILKPGMADRGMGIRLFNSKEALQQILEDFELLDTEESCDDDEGNDVSNTGVVTSQLRHFVAQEYIISPLLFDPREVQLNNEPKISIDQIRGHKFHLRVYCVASGALQLYFYDRILALFSAIAYSKPEIATAGEKYPTDLNAHLTNTSLQTSHGEEGVRLFDELIGCHIISDGDVSEKEVFTHENKLDIERQISTILADTFHAALANPVHFQPLENAFELYGIDFLVEYRPMTEHPFRVKLLEINAEPAIELTGSRLTWILQDLFISIGKFCLMPFIKQRTISELYGPWEIGQTKEHFIKCLEVKIRGTGV